MLHIMYSIFERVEPNNTCYIYILKKWIRLITSNINTVILYRPGLKRSSSSVSSSSRSDNSGSISSTGSKAEITGWSGVASVVVLVDNVLVATVLAVIIAGAAGWTTGLAGCVIISGWPSC